MLLPASTTPVLLWGGNRRILQSHSFVNGERIVPMMLAGARGTAPVAVLGYDICSGGTAALAAEAAAVTKASQWMGAVVELADPVV